VIVSNTIDLRGGSMDDLKEHPAAAPAGGEIDAAAIGSGRGRRRWLRVLLYLLAAVGLLALLTFAYAIYRHSSITPAPERVVIDEATVIDDVMGDAYGKYSAAKKGWVYVDDDVTYIMRVVQQVKIPDNPTGDEMYFVTSGVAVDGSDRARYGAVQCKRRRATRTGLLRSIEREPVGLGDQDPDRKRPEPFAGYGDQ
jgi:hypothetical protein